MNIEEANRAKKDKVKFRLISHGTADYASKNCWGKGIIEIVGKTEAQIICLSCSFHFIANLATLPEISDMRFADEYKDLIE